MPDFPMPSPAVLEALRGGLFIPAHPLALDNHRKFSERRQRALTRYYHAAGAGGLAVGVHSTQFAIRDPQVGLYRPVLELAAATAREADQASGRQTVLIAGVCGRTEQALAEAGFARQAGYHAGLLSLAALAEADDAALVAHCAAVAREIPLMGFYLQPAAGGRLLSRGFWERFMEIPNVVAVKIAPFNRYQTLDVVRALAESGRAGEIVLYTGNDDNILLDLLTEFVVPTAHGEQRIRIAGGLLGHWGCWTRRSVELFEAVKLARREPAIPQQLLTLAAQVTDCNAAIFDAPNQYRGALCGVSEVLRRQGLLENHYTLDPAESLSPGQLAEIERISQVYPHLIDDDFVGDNLSAWMR